MFQGGYDYRPILQLGKTEAGGSGSHSWLVSELGFNLRDSDFRSCLVSLFSTPGRAEQLPPWMVWSGDHCELSWGRQEFLPLGKLHYAVCLLARPPRENSAATKNDSGFLREELIFLIPSEKILGVILCSILDFCSGCILTKNAVSALPPWLFTPEVHALHPHLPFSVSSIHSQNITEDLRRGRCHVRHQVRQQVRRRQPHS